MEDDFVALVARLQGQQDLFQHLDKGVRTQRLSVFGFRQKILSRNPELEIRSPKPEPRTPTPLSPDTAESGVGVRSSSFGLRVSSLRFRLRR